MQRQKTIYKAEDEKPFKLSRSKIEFFLECPCCFYLDNKKGIKRPSTLPFTLNNAVDTLLKKEFDSYRNNDAKHPLIEKYHLDAKPAAHADLVKWRNNFSGISFLHKKTNFLIYGAIDDIWQNSKGEYIIVDYKATSKAGHITQLTESWHEGYKRQIEIYQWLFRQNGFPVSETAYFVYCNGNSHAETFSGKLEFDMSIIPHQGDDSWIERTIEEIYKCLNSDAAPKPSTTCKFCQYTHELKRLRDKEKVPEISSEIRSGLSIFQEIHKKDEKKDEINKLVSLRL